MVKKLKPNKTEFIDLEAEEIKDLFDMVNAMYPQATKVVNGEWDKQSPLTVYWDHTKTFASIDPQTGKNREAYIKITEGLHDGFLEIILVTPANTLNLKLRPSIGHLEAYHDNYTAIKGESHMNYHSQAYMGYEDLVKEQANGFESVLEESNDSCGCGCGDDKDVIEPHSDCKCFCHFEDCDCCNKCDNPCEYQDEFSIEEIFSEFDDAWDSLESSKTIDDNIFYGDNEFEWTDHLCEEFFNLLMDNTPPEKEDDTMCHCSECNQGMSAVCKKTYNIKEDPLWVDGSIVAGSKIRLMSWPKNEHIIIHDIVDEDGWNYAIIFRNQNGVTQSGVLMKQHLHQWERA